MHTVEFGAGMHVNVAAQELATAALAHGEAQGQFNGVTMRAKAGDPASAILANWHQQQEASAIAYRNSPEGKAAERRREDGIRYAQDTHDRLVRDLATLDFKNDVAVLDWLCAIQDSTDHAAVSVDKAAILSAFKAAGFEPNVNCGPEFKVEDRDNVFRWIVGQCLDCLKSVAIHGVVHKFVGDWKAKFVH